MRSIDEYLTFRHTAGFKLLTDALRLRSFGRFAGRRGEEWVRRDTAVEWAALGRTRNARHRRLLAVVRFARHVRVDDPSHQVPATDHFAGIHHRTPPYIYSRAEIGLLLEGVEKLACTDSWHARTFKTLFGLLAATGLRLSEALDLNVDDVRREDSLLVIRQTKFRKGRLVPIHASTLAAIDEYMSRRRRIPTEGTRLFVNRRGSRLPYTTLWTAFDKVRRGLPIPPGTRKPRIHDLRHTFAVRALEACPRKDRDRIGRHMGAISVYLGHVSLANTYWYFTATPQLMKTMANAGRAIVEKVVA